MIQAAVVDGFSLIGADALGGFWTLQDLQGWHDGVALRRSRQDKAQQDGAWESTGNKSGRSITVSGMARFRDPVSAKVASRNLRAIIGGGRADMTVIDSGGELHSTVELDDLKITSINELMFSWSVLLYAPDPLLYGPPAFGSATLAGGAGTGLVYPLVYPRDYGVLAGQTPGSVAVSNAGTASYWPRLRIDGPVPNPVVSLDVSGDWVRFNGVLATGQWLDIDLTARRVLLNGQVSLRQFVTSSGRWLAVPPGGGSVSWAADAADPAAKLSVWSYEGAWS
jgi:hypothetical protein